jgi:hypothetical protein
LRPAWITDGSPATRKFVPQPARSDDSPPRQRLCPCRLAFTYPLRELRYHHQSCKLPGYGVLGCMDLRSSPLGRVTANSCKCRATAHNRSRWTCPRPLPANNAVGREKFLNSRNVGLGNYLRWPLQFLPKATRRRRRLSQTDPLPQSGAVLISDVAPASRRP